MWYLVEDFFEQGWPVKLFIGWGWLSIVIMLASIYAAYEPMAVEYVKTHVFH